MSGWYCFDPAKGETLGPFKTFSEADTAGTDVDGVVAVPWLALSRDDARTLGKATAVGFGFGLTKEPFQLLAGADQ